MRRPLLLLILLLLITGCSTSKKTSTDRDLQPVVSLEREASVDDPEIKALLESYRSGLNEKVGGKVADVAYPLEFGRPESTLGNLAADALRFRASREARQYVNLAVIGEGSFRLNFNEGVLSLADVLEFMPYENNLVLLKLDGDMVYELSQQIAERGGAPVSGLRFSLQNGEAKQILVNSGVLNRESEYWLATSNWVADGGDNFTALLNPLERKEFDLSIRDLYIDYFRNQRTLAPEKDGRIRLR